MNPIMRYALLFFVGLFVFVWIHEAAHALAALSLGVGIQTGGFLQVPLVGGMVKPIEWTTQPAYVIFIVSVAPYILYVALGALAVGFHKTNAFPLVAYGLMLNVQGIGIGDFLNMSLAAPTIASTVSLSLMYLSFILFMGWGMDVITEYVKKEAKRQGFVV